jgi:hypothetical protein
MLLRNRKRSVFVDEGVSHMTFMTEVAKAVAVTITNASPPDVHPSLYSAVMGASNMSSLRQRWWLSPPLQQ